VLVAAAVGAAVAGWVWAGPVAAAFAGTYAGLVLRAVQGSRARRADRWATAAVEDLVSGLAADLRAGLAPAAALEGGAEALSFGGAPTGGRAPHDGGVSFRAALAPVLGAVAAGDDVPAALRRMRLSGTATGRTSPSVRPAANGLSKLAAAWQVADRSGAPLADVLDRLDAELGAAGRLRDRTEAHTAAASATVRLLAGLPVLGIGIGYALGGDPMTILLHTAPGMVCALVALTLQVTGLAWAERITGSAANARVPP
jgi:tight adherence protein B